MSKITDWNEVYLAAKTHLAQYGSCLQRYLSTEHCASVFTIIYLTNDQDQEIGQSWPGVLGIISSLCRIKVIYEGTMGFYVDDYPICGYEFILDDMEEIGADLDAAILKMERNME